VTTIDWLMVICLLLMLPALLTYLPR